MQLEIGISTNRYLPASGTAGLARSLVSGNKRVPWPPPMITDRTLLVLIDCRPVCDPATFGCSASLCILERFILFSPKIASSDCDRVPTVPSHYRATASRRCRWVFTLRQRLNQKLP